MARKPERNHEAYNKSAFSLKITNLILELQYGLMVINFDRAHVHTHTRTHILSKLVKNYCLTEVNT